jgi:hypothetical protein
VEANQRGKLARSDKAERKFHARQPCQPWANGSLAVHPYLPVPFPKRNGPAALDFIIGQPTRQRLLNLPIIPAHQST